MRYRFLIPNCPDIEKLNRHIDDIYISGWLSNAGPKVRELECEIAKMLQVEHVICVSSCSLGLLVLLSALDIPPASKVLLPSFNFPSPAEAVLWNRLHLKFSEVRLKDLTLDPENASARWNKQTRVLMPVHTFGNLAESEAFTALASERDCLLVFDGASAMGSLISNTKVASSGVGTIISFHATKFLPAGEGGAILLNDSNLDAECRRLINFGLENDRNVKRCGINAKMSELTAAFALAGLDDWHINYNLRIELGYAYLEALKRIPWLVPHVSQDAVMHLFPVTLQGDDPETKREELRLKWEKVGVEIRYYYYPPLHTMEAFQQSESHSLPITEELSKRVICLPFHTQLRPESILEIVDLIESIGGPE